MLVEYLTIDYHVESLVERIQRTVWSQANEANLIHQLLLQVLVLVRLVNHVLLIR